MSFLDIRFDILDWIIAVIAGIVTWLGLRFNFWHTPPFTYEVISDLTLPARQEFFSTFVWPAIILLSPSSVFLIRSIRGKSNHFTPLGQIALAWPVASFLLLNIHPMFGLCILPFGIVMSISSAIAYKDRRNNALPIMWSVIWLCFGALYFYRLLVLYDP